MEHLTRAEVTWIIEELDKSIWDHKDAAQNPINQGLAAGLHQLRAEQMESVMNKLRNTLTDGAKRIEIRY